MNRVRASITSGCLAVFFAACSISGTGGGEGGSGSGGNQSGGSGGSEQGGSGGSQSGGQTGSDQGGSGGSEQGGSGGSEEGGSGGSEKGGAGGTVKGGAGGTVKGGEGGTAVGGTTTKPTGKGGNTGGGTTVPSGGVQGSGGTTTPPGTGGVPPVTNTVVTSSNNNFWKSGTLTEASSGNADVTVNDGSALQNWEGMGGAFNELGWSYLTTDALKKEAIDLLFSTDGCNFAWGRIPIGASDYAMDRYTCDEGDDTSLGKFSISRDKQKLIPYIKAALAVKPDLKFWASPWTPPTWMKNPQGYDGGNMKSDDATVTAHTQYLVKWIQAYKDEGIKISVVAPQNEPGYAQGYPSCLWDKGTFVSSVKKLGPALTAAGLDTQVMLGTMSNSDSGKDPDIAAAVVADGTAKGIVKMIGVQWGMLDKVAGGQSYGGLPVWASETRCGNYPWNPSGSPKYVEPAPNDYAYAKETWGELKKGIGQAKVVSYNAWNMVLDKMGKGIDNTRQWAQDTLLMVDGGKITKTPAYYVFRHISQFAKAGGKVVSLSGGEGFGFKNPDNSIVAVLYTSSAKSNYTVKIGGKLYQFASPADGWSTVMVKP